MHDIDLIRWFTESEIAEVQPQLSSAVAVREDIALLQFRTRSGVLAHINTNWLTPFKARTVHVATRNKYITGDLITRQVTECFDYKPDGSYSMRHLSVAYAEPLRAELVAFIDAVRTGTAPVTGGADGLASLDIAMRCLADLRSPPATPRFALLHDQPRSGPLEANGNPSSGSTVTEPPSWGRGTHRSVRTLGHASAFG